MVLGEEIMLYYVLYKITSTVPCWENTWCGMLTTIIHYNNYKALKERFWWQGDNDTFFSKDY